MSRWLHYNVNSVKAESLLLEETVPDGSCILRNSFRQLQNYIISIRNCNKVSHIKVHHEERKYYLNRTDKFDTLTELIIYYKSNLLKHNCIQLPLFIPILPPQPTNERWYHGQLSRNEAKKLVLQKGMVGSYLVRESQSDNGDYVLTVNNSDDKVVEIKIRFTKNMYDIGGGKSFSSINDLMQFYSATPIVDQNGSVIHLRNSVNVTVINITEIVHHTFKLKLHKCKYTLGSGGFWEEFDTLQQWETKRGLTKDIGFLHENQSKNRYQNILPCDHSRIVLNNDCNGITSRTDYINANMIKLDPFSMGKYYKTHSYIVTQSCLPNTIVDFWKMICQEESCVIVMLTKLFEKSKDRCTEYWPPIGQRFIIGTTEISTLEEYTPQPEITVRIFKISFTDNRKRKIFQYHYTGWPEFGVPSDAGSFLELIYIVNARQFDIESQSNVSHPLTIHCSSGIGKTGTFVVLDLLIGYINRNGLNCKFDIQHTTHMVRSFRTDLIQSEAQYKFIYTAINHYVQSICSRIIAETKIKTSGEEYQNTKVADELANLVGKENVPKFNPYLAQKILNSAVAHNINPATDSALNSLDVNKSGIVELLKELNTPSATMTTKYEFPNSSTHNRSGVKSYRKVQPLSSTPANEQIIGHATAKVASVIL